MSTSTQARYSTRELQAAAAALAAGRFSTPDSRTKTPPTIDTDGDLIARTASCVSETIDNVTLSTPRLVATSTAATGLAPTVRLRASSAGAGASTVALALADAADASGLRTRLLDAAAPTWSGLAGATLTELGAAEGWRRGRRGAGVLIDRVQESVQVPAQVPSPRSCNDVDLTLLDAGWSLRELDASSPDSWLAAMSAQAEVLVTRPHGLALSQTEAALATLTDQLVDEQVAVVVVGAGRWSDREFRSAGPLLHRAHRMGAVLFMPLLTAKALPGLGPAALPKQFVHPSQRLLERVITITGPLTSNRTRQEEGKFS